jgi:NADH-quinone oxidoreductase subunit G
VPRRAGDRSALDAGCLPSLLPGGRPVASAEARADVAAAWGVSSLPDTAGLDTDAIIAAAASGELGALVVGGVDLDDLADPAAARDALRSVDFLVSLEVRESAVTAMADVVLPVAPPVEKAGTFINWEGRLRPFDKVLFESPALTDVRVLAGIAEELGRPIDVRTTDEARAEWHDLGPWDGKRTSFRPRKPVAAKAVAQKVVLDTWKLLVDDGRLQDGAEAYRLTAREPVLRASEATLTAFGVQPGHRATLTGPSGSASFVAEAAFMPDGVVWAPTNSGVHLGAALGVGFGARVSLSGGEA